MRKATILVAGLLFIGALAGCANESAGDPSVATGQGGSANPTATASFDPVKYSQCMKDNGMDWFPEAGTDTKVDIPDNVDRAKLDAALNACREFAPAGSTGGQAPVNATDQQKALAYAKCMRENGVPDFPDPAADGHISVNKDSGIDVGSDSFKAADKQCKDILPKDDDQ